MLCFYEFLGIQFVYVELKMDIVPLMFYIRVESPDLNSVTNFQPLDRASQ